MGKVYSLFNESGSMQEIKASDLQVNQLFFFHGYDNDAERRAIHRVEGDTYYWVNLDKSEKGQCQKWEIQPAAEIFGIGLYFRPDEFATPEDVAAAILNANAKKITDANDQRASEMEADTIREKGAKVLEEHMPEDCTHVILGELVQDECDFQSDYHGSIRTRTIILAFSQHGRDLFPEMRKAAANSPETLALATGDTETEHREKYSMGAGFYLKDGYRHSSGWMVQKCALARNHHELQLAAGTEGGFMVPVKDKARAKPAPAEKAQEPAEGPAREAEGVEVIQYSEKALALRGNTYPIKDQIKSLGGKFNRFLKDKNGERFAGWIISRKRTDEINKLVA